MYLHLGLYLRGIRSDFDIAECYAHGQFVAKDISSAVVFYNKAAADGESRANKIFLPTEESQHPMRSIHIGRHTTAAMDDVAQRMGNVLNRGEAEGWNQTQYRAELRSMLSEYRQELREGNIALNARHRPWAE